LAGRREAPTLGSMSFVARLVLSICAVIALAEPLLAQTKALYLEPHSVSTLAFRPGSNTELLMGAYDNEYRIQAHLVRLADDGKHAIQRTLPGFYSALAWLDANHLLTADDKGLLLKWPAAGGNPIQFIALGGAVTGIGVSSRTRTLAVRAQQGPLRIFNPDGKPSGPAISIGTREDCGADGLERVTAFSPDERLIVFADICGEIRVSSREGARLMVPARPPNSPQAGFVKRHAFSSDGRTLLTTYTGQPGGGAEIWPVAGGRLGLPKPLAGPIEHDDPKDIAALPDNAGFAVLSTHRLRFLGLDGKPTRPDIAMDTPHRIALSDDGSRIAVAAAEGIVLFDRTGKRLIDRPFAEFGAPVAVASLDGGKEFMALSREGVARFFRADGASSRPPQELWDYTRLDQDKWHQPTRFFVSPNRRVFAVHAPNNRFELFDANWNKIGRPFNFPRGGWYDSESTALLDDRILRPLPSGAGFVVFGFDGRVLGRLPLNNPPQASVMAAASANGALAAFVSDRKLRLWNAEGRLLRKRDVPNAPSPTSMVLSPDGRFAAMHEIYEGPITIWDSSERNSLESVRGTFVRLLPDGRPVYLLKDRLMIGPRGVDLDADTVHVVSDDGTSALVGKKGVVRLVTLPR
jgi:WD40 repeat protein